MDDIINRLNRAISYIKDNPEINIVGVREILIETECSLCPEVERYLKDIKEVRNKREENSFDNQFGALQRLCKIRDSYSNYSE